MIRLERIIESLSPDLMGLLIAKYMISMNELLFEFRLDEFKSK
jgi:hypothetical protein